MLVFSCFRIYILFRNVFWCLVKAKHVLGVLFHFFYSSFERMSSSLKFDAVTTEVSVVVSLMSGAFAINDDDS